MALGVPMLVRRETPATPAASAVSRSSVHAAAPDQGGPRVGPLTTQTAAHGLVDQVIGDWLAAGYLAVRLLARLDSQQQPPGLRSRDQYDTFSLTSPLFVAISDMIW
jgi:hypothetical protein